MLSPALWQLTYCSTSASRLHDLRKDVDDILREARIFNRQHRIQGVLFYGNHFFLQCLQGNRADLEMLYDKLQKDHRHIQLKLLESRAVETPLFDQWHMKYVVLEPKIQELLSCWQMQLFMPYDLSETQLAELLSLFSVVRDAVDTSRAPPPKTGRILKALQWVSRQLNQP